VGTVTLSNGIELEASIGGRFAGGNVVATYSKLRAKHVLTCWIKHLAACALGSDTSSFLVGKERDAKVKLFELSHVSKDDAALLLGQIVDFFWLGQRIALPFVPATSEAYARSILAGASAADALDKAFGEYKTEPDNSGGFDPYAVRAFDQRLPPFDAAYERGERDLDKTLFHAVALAVCGPMFRAGGALG
jgi:exodeoxyribonuclease V gamma subunit